MQITRKRISDSLRRSSTITCNVCNGRGSIKSDETIVHDIYQKIIEMDKSFIRNKIVEVFVDENVFKYVNSSEKSNINKLKEQFYLFNFIFKKDVKIMPRQFHIIVKEKEQNKIEEIKLKPKKDAIKEKGGRSSATTVTDVALLHLPKDEAMIIEQSQNTTSSLKKEEVVINATTIMDMTLDIPLKEESIKIIQPQENSQRAKPKTVKKTIKKEKNLKPKVQKTTSKKVDLKTLNKPEKNKTIEKKKIKKVEKNIEVPKKEDDINNDLV
jgi:hypothetical protein